MIFEIGKVAKNSTKILKSMSKIFKTKTIIFVKKPNGIKETNHSKNPPNIITALKGIKMIFDKGAVKEILWK